ncbi:imidazolonepropionase [Desulforhopalus singaporensis]|uniref:Imidazolonepropionase n=1 Tax=Desulforhopalus singaporensis TaxID=91360 RepID=A0A1H0RXF5_9BACT|nr:imidazolonepropionase [Desulforhopalus singaporensis]SDP34067.1 imidazolonepropionase [Desulforhopalus singaporensis]
MPTVNDNKMSDLNVICADSLVQICDSGTPRSGRHQGELNIIEDGAVAIREGKIVSVGTTEKVLDEAGECFRTLNAQGCSVLPGLVEAHSHPVFAGNRHWEYVRRLQGKSGESIRSEGGGIWSTIVNTRAADDPELEANTLQAFSSILAGGVTTLEVKSGYGLTTAEELRLLRILKQASQKTPMDIVFTFLGAHIAPQDGPTPDQFADLVMEEMLPEVARQGIADFHDITCEIGDFSPETAARLLAASRRINMPTRVHADASTHSYGWRTAVEGGAVAADHLTYTPDTEIIDIGATRTIAVLLPLAEQFYLDQVKANGRLFIETGVPVAIATDYCSSFQATSITLTIAMACSWFGLTPAEAIVGATLNSAYALGRGQDRGSLDVGKRGDLTILRCSHPNEIATRIGASMVRQVVSCGKVVYPR